jgi:hypothetical protein
MGELLGAAVAMALFGALIAWLLRKITSVSLIPSYAIGVFVMSFIAPALYALNSDGRVSYLEAWITYAIGGVLGFAILCLTAVRKRRTSQS